MYNLKKYIFFILSLSGIVILYIIHFFQLFNPVSISILDQTESGHILMKNYLIAFSFLYILFATSLWFLKECNWKRVHLVLISAFFIIASVAIMIFPSTSQDVYWNMALVKGYSVFHHNPYTTTINMLNYDMGLNYGNWLQPIKDWRDQPITQGPLWVWMLTPITLLHSVVFALMIVKILAAITFSISLIVLWKIMQVHGFTLERKVKTLGIVMINPFIIQLVLIDAHNDIYILLSILLSYYFLITKRYFLSFISLGLGGLIKFLPWLLLPLPLWHMYVQSQIQRRKRIMNIIASGCILLIISIFVCLPFIKYGTYFPGLQSEFGQKNIFFAYGPLALFIDYVVNPGSVVMYKLIGVIGGLIMLCIGLRYKHPLFAYTAPYILLLLCTSWFFPWYFLWIFFLCALYLPIGLTIGLSVILNLIPEVMPSLYLILPFGVYALYIVLIDRLLVERRTQV